MNEYLAARLAIALGLPAPLGEVAEIPADGADTSLAWVTELAGRQFSELESPENLLSDLFHALVKDERPAPYSLNRAVRAMFKQAQITVQTEIEVDARYTPNGRLTRVAFDYGFQNGRLHLMEGLELRRSAEQTLHAARELRARMEAARLASSAESFIVFYSGAEGKGERPELEDFLLPLEDQAKTIDVDDELMAREAVKSLLEY